MQRGTTGNLGRGGRWQEDLSYKKEWKLLRERENYTARGVGEGVYRVAQVTPELGEGGDTVSLVKVPRLRQLVLLVKVL